MRLLHSSLRPRDPTVRLLWVVIKSSTSAGARLKSAAVLQPRGNCRPDGITITHHHSPSSCVIMNLTTIIVINDYHHHQQHTWNSLSKGGKGCQFLAASGNISDAPPLNGDCRQPMCSPQAGQFIQIRIGSSIVGLRNVKGWENAEVREGPRKSNLEKLLVYPPETWALSENGQFSSVTFAIKHCDSM